MRRRLASDTPLSEFKERSLRRARASADPPDQAGLRSCFGRPPDFPPPSNFQIHRRCIAENTIRTPRMDDLSYRIHTFAEKARRKAGLIGCCTMMIIGALIVWRLAH
jgi:hypothetical protein